MRAAGVFTNKVTLSNWFTQTTMWPKRLALRQVQGKSRIPADHTRVIHIPRPQHAHITSEGLHDGQTYANLLTLIAGKLGLTTKSGQKCSQLANIAQRRRRSSEGSITAVVSLNAMRGSLAPLRG